MFAVIKTGGKQFKVTENDVIKVEKLAGASGDSIEFDSILMVGEGDNVKVGAPLVDKARVHGTILEQAKSDKVIVFKKKRRHNYRRKKGHRQEITVIRITDILAEGGSPAKKAAAPKAEAKAEVKAEPKAKTTEKAATASEKPTKKTASKASSKKES